MPVVHYVCDEGRNGYKIKLTGERIYFILNTEDGSLSEFDQRASFENALLDLKLNKSPKLNYGIFDETWSHYSEGYSRIDFSRCVPE
jgi:hypothetical protein